MYMNLKTRCYISKNMDVFSKTCTTRYYARPEAIHICTQDEFGEEIIHILPEPIIYDEPEVDPKPQEPISVGYLRPLPDISGLVDTSIYNVCVKIYTHNQRVCVNKPHRVPPHFRGYITNMEIWMMGLIENTGNLDEMASSSRNDYFAGCSRKCACVLRAFVYEYTTSAALYLTDIYKEAFVTLYQVLWTNELYDKYIQDRLKLLNIDPIKIPVGDQIHRKILDKLKEIEIQTSGLNPVFVAESESYYSDDDS